MGRAACYHDAVLACASGTQLTEDLLFEGRCWKFGDNVPTDAIAPTHTLVGGLDAIREHVLGALNPEFPKKVEPGDIVCAGRNFGCSSGRAIATKALKAVGVGAVVAESFSRTFYRNGFEVGLPLLQVAALDARDGDRLRVNVAEALVENLTRGGFVSGAAPAPFLLTMLRAGGIIALAKSGGLKTLWPAS